MRKLFASDLDQTLIYSKKFLSELSSSEIEKIVMVEDKYENIRSYMSRKTVEKIEAFSRDNIFVPTTTRTIEQYLRIFVFSKQILPKYAVVSNGGNILLNGEIDKEWNTLMKNRLKNECIQGKDVLKKFDEFKDDLWTTDARHADSLFFYFIIQREKYPLEKMVLFEEWLNKNGWRLSIQKRKMYFVPKVIEKYDAVKHIANREGIDNIIAAGDSILDLGMIYNANMSFVPNHSTELQYLRDSEYKHIVFTKSSGIFSSEEMVSFLD